MVPALSHGGNRMSLNVPVSNPRCAPAASGVLHRPLPRTRPPGRVPAGGEGSTRHRRRVDRRGTHLRRLPRGASPHGRGAGLPDGQRRHFLRAHGLPRDRRTRAASGGRWARPRRVPDGLRTPRDDPLRAGRRPRRRTRRIPAAGRQTADLNTAAADPGRGDHPARPARPGPRWARQRHGRDRSAPSPRRPRPRPEPARAGHQLATARADQRQTRLRVRTRTTLPLPGQRPHRTRLRPAHPPQNRRARTGQANPARHRPAPRPPRNGLGRPQHDRIRLSWTPGPVHPVEARPGVRPARGFGTASRRGRGDCRGPPRPTARRARAAGAARNPGS